MQDIIIFTDTRLMTCIIWTIIRYCCTGAMNYKSPSSPESHADPDLTGVTDTSSPDVCILGWDGPTTCLQNYARLVGLAIHSHTEHSLSAL